MPHYPSRSRIVTVALSSPSPSHCRCHIVYDRVAVVVDRPVVLSVSGPTCSVSEVLPVFSVHILLLRDLSVLNARSSPEGVALMANMWTLDAPGRELNDVLGLYGMNWVYFLEV